MARVLTSFSGKFGDILWALPTVRAVSQMKGERVDFCCMPQYKSLLPLIQAQPYVDKAFVVEDWLLQHSNHGDQPWNPPARIDREYDQSWHLGYRAHPGLSGQPNMSLIDFIAWQQGIRFTANPIPFISGLPFLKEDEGKLGHVAYAFNDMYSDLKLRFFNMLVRRTEVTFVDVSKRSWLESVSVIKGAVAYVGDRSALHVVAHGVGQRLITYEPHPARNKQGHLGTVFGCPYGRETALPLNISPEQAAERTVELLNEMKAEEKKHENDQAIAG